MTHYGPELSLLIHHLSSCPPECLREPGQVDTLALCRDTLRMVCRDPRSEQGERTVNLKADRDALLTVQIGCWLFSHEVFHGWEDMIDGMIRFFEESIPEIAPHVTPETWPGNMERCEEFCRLALAACELIPEGETDKQAFERFESVSTLKRKNILSKTAASYQRMQELRRKMAEKAAREAANVYGRE